MSNDNNPLDWLNTDNPYKSMAHAAREQMATTSLFPSLFSSARYQFKAQCNMIQLGTAIQGTQIGRTQTSGFILRIQNH